ncbi:GMC family oxidoreductase [Vibrio cholerae]|uniref:GMC oxidoreductase n=1 Tax=Vibrio cholerae TaxID=666 RepID=UPI0011D47853|nr:GMC oxidoreductase [Vibrio cholerae]EGR2537674.1 GMC family oxidoreductase [Vibrio cholerae]EJL6293467.1 GMC family oxidoreductase [Vibrio cholerae]EKI0759080.1 GMC family oxidoreductase [Vibrio cholerae]TXZ65738.1 GMC family oxidoreductase [Vibrio cholerae]BCN20533.1 putative monosaccharide biosynthesis protein [Vibrio cholerae]
MRNRILVIGSGVGGCTIANQLSAENDVTVIECGPKGNYQIPSKTYLNEELGSTPTYCKGLGGTSNLWHNGLIELPPDDIEHQDFRKLIEKSNFYINNAASSLNLKGNYLSIRNEVRRVYAKVCGDIFGSNTISLDTIIVPEDYVPLTLNDSISTYFNAEIERFEFDADGNVKCVEVRSENETKKLFFDTIVICAGGIGTPYILSKLVQNKYGKNIVTSIGQGFIDHPMGFLGKIRVRKEKVEAFKKLVSTKFEDCQARCGIKLSVDGLNHICYFRPAFSMKNELDIYKFKSKLGSSTLKERFKFIFHKKTYHPDILQEIWLHFTGKQVKSEVYAIWVVFEQRDRTDNFISLREKDQIHWSISEKELSNYSKTLQLINDILLPVAQDINMVQSDLRDFLWSAAHHSSTVPMNNNIGCVNNELKVNGFDNVFVCDGSIIQNHSYTNTGLTIAQLAHWLAHKINKVNF